MPDPITTIVTNAIEHAPNAAAVAAAYKVAKSFLAKVAGPAVEELGEIGRDYVKGWRAKNGSAVLTGADKLLAEAGREPQAVPLKVLLPLLDAASLEDEPALAAHWAALLANAADPAQQVTVQPGFAEVLRQLTPMDARVLTILYGQTGKLSAEPQTISLPAFELSLLIGLDYNKTGLIVDNLLRLQLCQAIKGDKGLMPAYLTSNIYGFYFMQAVTPPTP